jgi:hypothetical protein
MTLDSHPRLHVSTGGRPRYTGARFPAFKAGLTAMGGLASQINLRRTGLDGAAPLRTAYERLVMVSRHALEYFFGGTPKPYGDVLRWYWGDARDDDQIEVQTGTLWFCFMDRGGAASVAAIASLHWFELAIARLWEGGLDEKVLRPIGWELADAPRASLEQAHRPLQAPLLVVRWRLYAVVRGASSAVNALTADDPSAPAFHQLGRASQRKVQDLYASGRCECRPCVRIRADDFQYDHLWPLTAPLVMKSLPR